MKENNNIQPYVEHIEHLHEKKNFLRKLKLYQSYLALDFADDLPEGLEFYTLLEKSEKYLTEYHFFEFISKKSKLDRALKDLEDGIEVTTKQLIDKLKK